MFKLDRRKTGDRLFKIRYIHGYGDRGGLTRFADEVFKTSKGTYGGWENDETDLPKWRAVELLNWDNRLTLDYLYLGDFRGMETALADLLRAAPLRPEDARTVSGKKPPPKKRPDAEAAAMLEDLPQGKGAGKAGKAGKHALRKREK